MIPLMIKKKSKKVKENGGINIKLRSVQKKGKGSRGLSPLTLYTSVLFE